jgi:nitrate reductase beta subunit
MTTQYKPKIRAQIAMVLNLDKCIGCHTCSVTCKNVWTSRRGVEYAWFNNVETKPGVGFPTDWENQQRWNGGWHLNRRGRLELKQGSKIKILAKIFANPNLPQIDDYYEPFTLDYQHGQHAPKSKASPVATPMMEYPRLSTTSGCRWRVYHSMTKPGPGGRSRPLQIRHLRNLKNYINVP